MTDVIAGGCLCGAVRYAADAAPINVRVCHCRACQKATGAPLFARVAVPLDRVRVTGTVGWFASSAALRRGFCPACGTTLFSERAGANVMGLTTGSLDDPDAFVPEVQIWTSARQVWVAGLGDVPACTEGMPA